MIPQPFTFALCRETSIVSVDDLLELAPVLEQNAQHCAAAWKDEGILPPAVVLAEDGRNRPAYLRPMVCVDGEGDPGTLAVHYVDPVTGGPAGRAFCDHGTGLRTEPYSITEALAHEVLEALVNPGLTGWRPLPGRPEVEVALEVGDPCQDTYAIEHAGKRWPVANFVYPAWFDVSLNDSERCATFLASGGKFDHAGRIKKPGRLGPDGYMVLRRKDPETGRWNYWQEWGGQPATPGTAKAVASKHPWSRTLRLLAHGAHP